MIRMTDIKIACTRIVAQALDIDAALIQTEIPPDPKMGDIGIPLFNFARTLRMSPQAIAEHALAEIQKMDEAKEVGTFFALGPYLNVRLNRGKVNFEVLSKINSSQSDYGKSSALAGEKIMLEFSSPNTNKPLHLGHMRNDALGESVSRILKTAGASVYKVCILNDRGTHICKSMLAYQKFHEAKGETPESTGIKSDKFVGNCYVEFAKYAATQSEGSAEAEAQAMTVAWEKGDESVRTLWKRMNEWATRGMRQTYERTGISFDKYYFESETYLKGKEEILRGLDDGLFYREADGSVWVDLAEINLDKKVLLRKDGTSLYMTQDVGTAIARHSDWSFDRMVYVVGSEQQYHFKVLFYILKKLGLSWAENLYHLSYGMVNLPEGRMKTREGTVVDADDLLDNLRTLASGEIEEKGRSDKMDNPLETAEKIAIGALHYFLLSATAPKDMLFNPKESLSFNGNTGPYLQYMGARICSILRKAAEEGVHPDFSVATLSLLTGEEEWALVKLLADFPAAIEKAAAALEPSILATHVYETAKAFASFYHECPILGADSQTSASARLALAVATKQVLESGMNMILVPFLESM
ncbi:MAG: arginine--tRNA ligase [Treponemataceae bacterium]|nr:MAG: arginine--tRNA ligase [Treponemataceae bacterium]